jgi:hypothetical protein
LGGAAFGVASSQPVTIGGSAPDTPAESK